MADPIAEFLDGYAEDVAQLSAELRRFVKEVAPEATETLHIGWKVVSYGYRKKFCAIAPHAHWVNLQFHSGAALKDADGLLRGGGKSMRHTRISATEDIDSALGRLIGEAASHAR